MAVKRGKQNRWISGARVRVRRTKRGLEVDVERAPRKKKRKPAKKRNATPRASRRTKKKTEKRMSAALKRYFQSRR